METSSSFMAGAVKGSTRTSLRPRPQGRGWGGCSIKKIKTALWTGLRRPWPRSTNGRRRTRPESDRNLSGVRPKLVVVGALARTSGTSAGARIRVGGRLLDDISLNDRAGEAARTAYG